MNKKISDIISIDDILNEDIISSLLEFQYRIYSFGSNGYFELFINDEHSIMTAPIPIKKFYRSGMTIRQLIKRIK